MSRGGAATEVEGLIVERQLATTGKITLDQHMFKSYSDHLSIYVVYLRVRWVVASDGSSLCTIGAASAGDLPVLRSRRNSGYQGGNDDAEAHYVQGFLEEKLFAKGTRPIFEANVELKKRFKQTIGELEVDAGEKLLEPECEPRFI